MQTLNIIHAISISFIMLDDLFKLDMKIRFSNKSKTPCCFFCGSCLLFVFHVCPALQPCGHLLEKGLPHGPLVCDALLCFCNFPMW